MLVLNKLATFLAAIKGLSLHEIVTIEIGAGRRTGE